MFVKIPKYGEAPYKYEFSLFLAKMLGVTEKYVSKAKQFGFRYVELKVNLGYNIVERKVYFYLLYNYYPNAN